MVIIVNDVAIMGSEVVIIGSEVLIIGNEVVIIGIGGKCTSCCGGLALALLFIPVALRLSNGTAMGTTNTSHLLMMWL